MIEAIIYYKNGEEDSIDPVNSIGYTDDSIVIDNGFYSYIYPLLDIEKVEIKEKKEDKQ